VHLGFDGARFMISLRVNGKLQELPPGSTMSDLLTTLHINSRYCAVECNRDLVPRENHATTTLTDGDEIEIVTLVGGG
jgi:sulfur carrier protein